MTLDLNELFGGATVMRYEFEDRILRYHIIPTDKQTDLAYQRRLSQTRSNRGMRSQDSVLSDEALEAEVWLFDHVCTKVEVEDTPLIPPLPRGDEGGLGADRDPPVLVDVPDFRERIEPAMKRQVLRDYRLRRQQAAEEQKNS